MITDFDPLKLLQDITDNQTRLNENQIRLNSAFTELVTSFNELNRRLCIQENALRELELQLAGDSG